MKNTKFLAVLACLGLLITGCTGQGGSASIEESKVESSEKASENSSKASSSQSSAKSSEKQSSAASSSQAVVHTHDYEAVGTAVKNADDKDVFLMECKQKDDRYIGIAFSDFSAHSADFDSKVTSYNSVPDEIKNSGYLLNKDSTVSWKINVDKAITGAKLVFGATMTSSSHSVQVGTTDSGLAKYSIQVNDGELTPWALTSNDSYESVGLTTSERVYVTFGTIDLVAGENTIVLRQNNAGYRLIFGGEVRVHYNSDAKPVVAPVPFEGYKVTFVPTNCKVFVYSTKQYDTETPVETNTCVAKDEDGNVVAYDTEDILAQPQVSFKVVCEENCVVALSDIVIEGTYKNLKQGPNASDGLPDAEHFRITKVQTDLKITITARAGELKTPEATFVTNHCSVVVYKSATIADDNIDTGDHYYARDSKTGDAVQSGGQVNFKVIPETGYKWNPGVEGEVAIENVPFIYRASKDSGKNFKVLGDDCYRITKLNDDVAININCVPVNGEAGLGHEITFVTTNCKVLVYETQDYRFTPTALVDNKTLSRTSKGDAAKYAAATDTTEEIKPQVNFLVVCDEGYEFNSGVEVGAEAKAKDITFITGSYNKFVNVGDGIFKVTKIQGDLVITITATAKAA